LAYVYEEDTGRTVRVKFPYTSDDDIDQILRDTFDYARSAADTELDEALS
jgi:hypothetical protein